jgi:hypothetical protein
VERVTIIIHILVDLKTPGSIRRLQLRLLHPESKVKNASTNRYGKIVGAILPDNYQQKRRGDRMWPAFRYQFQFITRMTRRIKGGGMSN